VLYFVLYAVKHVKCALSLFQVVSNRGRCVLIPWRVWASLGWNNRTCLTMSEKNRVNHVNVSSPH
jgi:hypothetical protein